MKSRSSKFLFFLIGLGALTQIRIGGSIGISELVFFVVAPFIFINDISVLRRDGFMPVISLAIMAMVGCFVSCIVNGSPFPNAIRGLAECYSIFAAIVVYHRLLRNNIDCYKWVLLGFASSEIVNIFAFHKGTDVFFAGGVGADEKIIRERIMAGPLFWMQKIGAFLTLPVTGWYLSTPFCYCVIAPLIMSAFTLATTSSGRSAFLISLLGVVIIFIGGKKLSKMRLIQKHILASIFGLMIFAFAVKSGYKFLAENGYLNEKARQKYEDQTKGGTGLISMIVGGRSVVFASLYACLERPIWGYGPWAVDSDGLYAEFLYKYGNEEEYKEYEANYAYSMQIGKPSLIPGHSHIFGFWVSYGILALPFWVYVYFLIFRHLRKNMAVIPQLYGYFALAIAGNLWHILFSPYGSRMGVPLMIVLMLFADAVRKGQVLLPTEMQMEIMKMQRNERPLWRNS